jgi:hypothetical protein
MTVSRKKLSFSLVAERSQRVSISFDVGSNQPINDFFSSPCGEMFAMFSIQRKH